ncbi:MAG: hypothetical protein LBE80_04250, partial [Deltaproteobacteria bacterium]|nr:hypothetical protein [Deltaproteobacteria bacterium]
MASPRKPKSLRPLAAQPGRPRLALALGLSLTLILVKLFSAQSALGQGGFFAPEEQIANPSQSQAASGAEGKSPPEPDYNLPDWVPRYPNTNRPYWLPPEDGSVSSLDPAGPLAEPLAQEGGFFSPPLPLPP